MKREFLGKGTLASKVELDEVQQIEEPAQSSEPIEPELIRSELVPEVALVRRSDRVPR